MAISTPGPWEERREGPPPGKKAEGADPEAREELFQRLRDLEDLNPDLPGREVARLEELARLCGPECFPAVARQVRRLLDLYLGMPTLQVGRAILGEYFHLLEAGAARLLAAREISPRPALPAASGGVSQALVLYSAFDYTPADRCRILSRTEIPETLSRAADAFRRRVEVVDTVFGLGFRVMWLLDPLAFQQWATDYLTEKEGDLAPEVIRDMLWVMGKSQALSPAMTEWLFRWCGDMALLEDWPLVVCQADRLADRLFLLAWEKGQPTPRNGRLAHLRLMVQGGRQDEERLLAWLENSLQDFGGAVARFLSFDREATSPQEEEWLHCTLLAELQGMEALYQPILVLSDLLLRLPDGAMKLAMAFLGVAGQSLREWENAILRFSERLIRRAFLVDLKEGRPPVDTIRKFTFGDETAYAQICNELDLLTQQFDSIPQREKVIRRLGVYYASYRRAPMLGQEVGRRYRRMARLLHEDFLKAHLSQEEWEGFQARGFLQDLYSMASRSKRFLDHRRALDMSIEEMVASQIEFVEECRSRRLAMLRRYSPLPH